MDFRPLHRDLGVEVLGFDIARDRDPATIAALRAAHDRHAMLLFRGAARLSPERHAEIAGWFGPPGPVDNSGRGDFVTVLQNSEPAGSFRLPFHSDQTYMDEPVAAICLQAIELPENPTSTTFVSGAAVWRDLPGDMQERLSVLTLRHFYSSRMPGLDWPDFVAEHPVRLLHPRTGQPILFVTENHAQRILELGDAQSAALIADLLERLYRPERRYEHVWQTGDVLMWDNLVLQHARTQESDPGEGPRALQRVALCSITLDEQIALARARSDA